MGKLRLSAATALVATVVSVSTGSVTPDTAEPPLAAAQAASRQVTPGDLTVSSHQLPAAFSYEVEILTQAPGGQLEPFREGRIDVRRAEAGTLETSITYTRDGATTGTFTILQDTDSLAMRRFEYRPNKRLARPQAIWIDGNQLLGKSGLLQRQRHLESLGHGVFAPENKEAVLPFIEADPGEEFRVPLAGFGEPATGWWSVRYDGPGTRMVNGAEVETRTWTSLSNDASIVTVDRPPYVLGFDFLDPSGVRWLHRTLCDGTPDAADPLAACLLDP